MPKITTEKPGDLASVANKVLSHVDALEHAVVVALHGDLGAGKTTFVQMLAKRLGITEDVTSPTFVIMKQYDATASQTDLDLLVHIDAYRIEDPHEMDVLGFDELLATPKTLICIEWAEKIQSILPKNLIDVNIEITNNDGGREITIHGY